MSPEERYRIHLAYQAIYKAVLTWHARSMEAEAARAATGPLPPHLSDDDPQDDADGQFEGMVTAILERLLTGEEIPYTESILRAGAGTRALHETEESPTGRYAVVYDPDTATYAVVDTRDTARGAVSNDWTSDAAVAGVAHILDRTDGLCAVVEGCGERPTRYIHWPPGPHPEYEPGCEVHAAEARRRYPGLYIGSLYRETGS